MIYRTLSLPILLLCCPAGGATYYASPAGGGDGGSPGSPVTVAGAWALVSAGDTVNLIDGTYTGASSMIVPPNNLSGSSGNPITVQALNDGAVLINGQNVRRPVYLEKTNDWFVLRGFNACRSSYNVVEVSYSSHCQVSKVCGWDALDANNYIFTTHYGTNNVFEDCAGWGTARKVFDCSAYAHSTTFRRCFFVYQGSTWDGPNFGMTLLYNSTNNLAENCVGMWDSIKTPAVSWCVKGPPALSNTDGCYTNSGGAYPKFLSQYEVDQPYGTFSNDSNNSLPAGPKAGPYLYGCISIMYGTNQCGNTPWLFHLQNMQVAQNIGWIQDCASAVVEQASVRPFYLDASCSGSNLTSLAAGTTSYYGSGSYVQRVDLSNNATGIKTWQAMFRPIRPTTGAHLYYRYVDKTITTTALWPWPMNQRIKDLIGLDVTALATMGGSGGMHAGTLHAGRIVGITTP